MFNYDLYKHPATESAQPVLVQREQNCCETTAAQLPHAYKNDASRTQMSQNFHTLPQGRRDTESEFLQVR